MGRAIGGQAHCADSRTFRVAPGIGRDQRPTQVLRKRPRCCAVSRRRRPWPLWTKRANGGLLYANAAYVRAADAVTSRTAIDRNLELLDSGDRSDMDRALTDKAAFAARLPIVVGGERRFYDVQALNVGGRAMSASPSTPPRPPR